MICKQGTFVEYSVFKNEVQVDWTIISNKKGMHTGYNYIPKLFSYIHTYIYTYIHTYIQTYCLFLNYNYYNCM